MRGEGRQGPRGEPIGNTAKRFPWQYCALVAERTLAPEALAHRSPKVHRVPAHAFWTNGTAPAYFDECASARHRAKHLARMMLS